MKVTVTVDFGLKKKNIVMEGANVDYLITKGLFVVTSDKYSKYLGRLITTLNKIKKGEPQ